MEKLKPSYRMPKRISNCWIWRPGLRPKKGFAKGSRTSREGEPALLARYSKKCAADVEYRVRLARRAIRDLEHIYEYIHADSSSRAFAWFKDLENAVYSLRENPQRGTTTRERTELRQLLHGRKPHIYRIIYSIHEPTRAVNVVHIRHGAQDSFGKRESE